MCTDNSQTKHPQNTPVLLRSLQNQSHFQSMWSMGLWWQHHAQMVPVQTADWAASAFPAPRQGWHYIRPDVPPKGQGHHGPGAQNTEHEVSTSQTLQPFLNKCPPCVNALVPSKFAPDGKHSWINNFPLHTRLSLLWESFCLKIISFWQQAAENRMKN